MVYEELEHLRLETWSKSIKQDDTSTDGTMLQIPNHLLQYCDTEAVSLISATNMFSNVNLLLLLSWNYKIYCESLSTSSDEICKFVSQFMSLAEDYFLFIDSVRVGNSVTLECVFLDGLTLWKAAGKLKYVKLTLTICNIFYSKLNQDALEEWRWNRLIRLHVERAMVEMDCMCEILNEQTKSMAKSDEIKSLKEKMMFVSLMRQCSRDISTAGRTSNNTCAASSISPRQVLERKALTTLFVAAGIWKPDERKLRDPFLWEYHECAKMTSVKTHTGDLDEYESAVDNIFGKLAQKQSEYISQEELDSIMQEVDANVLNDDDEIQPSDLLDPDNVDMPDTVEDPELNHIADEDDNIEDDTANIDVAPAEELESIDESESTEEVLRELNNLTKYKLNKTGLENLRIKGLAMLGPNLQEEHQLKIKHVKRDGDEIDAAINHYHKNQIFRRKK
eukprot:scaffold1711_cov60-Attheya_sp.AAC.4